MKKYVAFFVSIGIILGAILVFNVMNVEKSKKVEFSEAGYILDGSTDRYYFQQDEAYTTSYDDKIVFYDTEGAKVTLDSNNFIHYTSGNIVALQESVLLDLSKINDNPIIYYNVAANKEIKKVSNRYTVKNLDNDLQFEQAIWKISSNKYIVLANNLTVVLNNGTTKDINGYVEIEYFDNQIVNIYNQEFNYQTISSNSYIELENDIKLNLGTKIVSQKDMNKMSLEDMVINSDDNVTLIDLNEDKNNEDKDNEDKNNEVDSNNEIQTGNTQTTGGSSSSTTTNNNSTTIVQGGNNGTANNEESGKINIELANIIYEYVDDNESKVDESLALAEPKFKLENMDITATGIKADIQITDDDDTLSKSDDIVVKIINNVTGKTVYLANEAYGTFNIPLDIEVLLPDTSYTITVSATYAVNDNNYTKTFLYKTFVTSSIGVAINKEAYTDNSLSFIVSFSDKLVDSAEISLLDSDGNELINRKKTIKNSGTEGEEVVFDGLTTNTSYIARISKISYNGMVQEGENWKIDTPCKTLKSKISINNLNYSINKRDGTFTLYIDSITDPDNAIQNYKYVLYKFTEVEDENGNSVLGYDTEKIAYQRETTSKEITLTVADEGSGENVVRGQYYGFQIIATTYDNEKYVDVESSICGAFALNGVTFPSVKFERVTSNYPPTEICGWLYIIDNQNTITVDNDNPLTITYYSDVDEGELYTKRTNLDADEKTTDEAGNEVIKIWINLGEKGSSKKGLKSETSYTFSVYGTVDLKDGNGDYKNVHIGSAIVTTAPYESLTANLTTENIQANAFTVDLSLDGDDVAREGLTSVNIMLYEGSGDINVGEYNNWSRTITTDNYGLCLENKKYDTEVNSLQDLLFDNALVITPSFIGGGKESSYTEVNYQVVVTATIDGTEYSNKIPIQVADDDDENTGNTTYTDKQEKETYTAAYIIVDGKGTTADVSEDFGKITATAITNKDAGKYNLKYDSELQDSTYVGYYVSTGFTNTGSLTAKSITYYVWDQNGNPVLDEDGTQVTKTLDFTNQEKSPSAVFELGYGTINSAAEDNRSGMHRGDAYFFSYTVTYLDTNGAEIIWPNSESNEEKTYDNKSLATDVLYPNKQTANFVMYPKTSDSSTITYAYSCSDPDKALYYPQHSTTEYAYLNLSVDGTVQSSNNEVKTDGLLSEITFGPLSANTTYTIGYTENLNKVRTSTYTSKNLVTQKFEGIVNCDDIAISRVTYNDADNPNNVRIQLTGSTVNRVAAVVVTFSTETDSISTKMLKLDTENGNYLNVSFVDLIISSSANLENYIGKDITVNVTAYYDNGKIGFVPNDGSQYATYVNTNNLYMKLESNNLMPTESINGNIFEYQFSTSNDSARLGLKTLDNINENQNGTTLELLYSPSGLQQNGAIVVQKQIATKQITAPDTINISNVRLALKVNSIDTTLTTANIKANLINPLNLPVDNLYAEIWHSKNKEEEPNWNECESKIINTSDLGNLTLDNLAPAEYYYIRFKYLEGTKYVYTYDFETAEVGKAYQFETLATIGIDNLNVEYDAENYTRKYLDISYDINQNRSNMYEKTKYTFYRADGTTKINLTQNNIKVNNDQVSYQIVDGSLVVTNPNYSSGDKVDSIFEQVYITPQYNPFTMGEDYILKVTPIVTVNGTDECEIENASTTFTLKTLTEPLIGLKMERKQTTGQSKYIRTLITIKDADAMISGSDWGEYELHVYKYKDNIDNALEVDIYDRYQGGNNVTGKTFNLKDNGTNYSVYVQNEDIDYTYNYIAKMTFKYDKTNTGADLKDKTEQYTLKAMNNDFDIAIGSTALIQNGNNCEVRFYDSYNNIDQIDKITYSVFNLSNNYSTTATYKPEWTLVNDIENSITYYKTTLPLTFDTTGTYTIKMNLYSQNVLIDQIDTTFIYEQQ